ncbi:MAG: transglutaminase domain-containing protein [Bacteroidaceae bacterium]|nr:transglutaminase domain-containing protein [Bacteroidaceae bacterium]
MIVRKLFAVLLVGIALSASAQSDVDFLYKSMPLCDKADYPRDFFKTNATLTRRAVAEMPWGTQLDETLIRHFVLPLRVNNEPLDSFRIKYYDTLKARVSGMNMTAAAIAINHWCHEHVTYQPSDGRTSSPLQSLLTAYGRCGEESTLCVAAMRTVGIPARQVYTPRWAHCDDNHAWVEVWTDGKWHFLGACEPEPVLDLGWFNAPASRGMMMHTCVFGNYSGPEEIVLRTPTYTEINVTSNYAPTRRVDFLVLQDGKPADNAKVQFKIYNYAEFYNAVTRYTDSLGNTYLTSGCGDLLVWASKGDRYGFIKADFAKDTCDTIHLDHDATTLIDADIDINVPEQHYTLPHVTAEQRSENDRLTALEDEMRRAYEASMVQKKDDMGAADSLLWKARGNHSKIRHFIDEFGTPAITLLSTLSEKDLRDVSLDILTDHLKHSPHKKGVSEKEYRDHVLCPRAALEPLSPYKGYFQNAGFTFKTADEVEAWCNANLTIEHRSNINGTYITPIGVYNTKRCDPRSRNLFFVSVCRASGIPAWIDAVTGEVCTADKRGIFSTQNAEYKKQGACLVLTGDTTLSYYTRFTLSKLENGTLKLLTYPEEATIADMQNGVELEAGHYVLTTGTRYNNGNVLAHIKSFALTDGETTTVEVAPRSVRDTASVFGTVEGIDGPCVVALLAEGQEPSNHVVRDLAARKADFESMKLPIVCCFPSEEQLHKFDKAAFPAMPAGTRWTADGTGEFHDRIARVLPIHNASNLPIVVLIDKNSQVVFYRQGYTIGIGDDIINKMKDLPAQ